MFLVGGPVWLVIEIWSGVGAPAVDVDLLLCSEELDDIFSKDLIVMPLLLMVTILYRVLVLMLKPNDSMERLLRL